MHVCVLELYIRLLWLHALLISNFPVGLAPPKKAPGAHQICRTIIGKMLLEAIVGAFFGVPNHQENYNS